MQSATGLLDVFPVGPGRVLVVQAVDAAPTLVAGLTAKSWEVTAIAPYRTVTVTPPPDVQAQALDADALLLASGSAARAWVEVFGVRAPSAIVAIGPQTATAAQAVGLKIA